MLCTKSSALLINRTNVVLKHSMVRSFHHQKSKLNNQQLNSDDGLSLDQQTTTTVVPELAKQSNIARLARLQTKQMKIYEQRREQLEDFVKNKLLTLKKNSEAKVKEIKNRMLEEEAREARKMKIPKRPLLPRVQFVKKNYPIVRSELSQSGELSVGTTRQDVSDNFKKIQQELTRRFNSLTPEELAVYELLHEQDKLRYEAELKELKDNGYGFKLIEKEGDLFDSSNSDPICIGISADLSTNFGIAKQCMDYFPHIQSLAQLSSQPCILAYDSKHGKEILFLLTKQKNTDKANYNNYKQVLNHARQLIKRNGIERISMPRIGCGGNKLDWNEMKSIIESCFEGTNITITVHSLPPNDNKRTTISSNNTSSSQ